MLSEKKPIFVNDAFCAVFPKEILDGLYGHKLSMDDFIKNGGNCSYGISATQTERHSARSIVCVKVQSGKKIYFVDKKDIFLEGEVGVCRLYAFTDITLLEYQRLKLKNNYERLRELFMARQRCGVLSPQGQESQKDEVLDIAPVLLLIGEHEKNLLRKSRDGHKLTAVEYIADISEDVLDELTELSELEKEMEDALVFFEEKHTIESLSGFLTLLHKHARIVKRLVEFFDLAFTLESLRSFLASLSNDAIDDKRVRKLSICLSGIIADLVSWRTTIFVSHIAEDIHYLDSSLFSSCLQIQMDFSGSDSVEEDDLDIFF